MIYEYSIQRQQEKEQTQMKFSEAVKQYSNWKLENKGTAKVSSNELASLRKQYREGNIVDSTQSNVVAKYAAWKLKEHGTSKVSAAEKKMLLKESANVSIASKSDIVKQYSSWKLKEHGTSKVTKEEVKKLTEATRKPAAKGNKLSEAVKGYSEWKMANHGSSEVTLKEVKAIKARLMEGDQAAEDQTAEAPAEETADAAADGQQLQESMREARKAIYRAKKALREGDMAAAQDATMDAADAMEGTMGVADAAAQGQVPQNVVDAVTAIQASVNDLATQCGIEPPVDPAADPAAGVPAVDGVADPNTAMPAPAADPNAQMMESVNLSEVRNRLKERETRLDAVKGITKVATAVKNPLADVGDTLNDAVANGKREVAKGDSPDTVPSPSLSSLVDGTEKGAIKWPTEKVAVKESSADAYLEKRIRESKEAKDFSWANILQSGILG